MFEEELTCILLKLLKRITKEWILLNSFYKASVTLITKTKDTTKIEKYKKVWLMNVDVKILNKISANWNQQYIEKIICYEQAGLILGMQA